MYSDRELLDYLQKLQDRNRYTGRCVLRESVTGRGWRLHESSDPDAQCDVRLAIQNYMQAHP